MSDPSDNPPPTRQIQWPRFAIEGVVIVASILLAFGIEASWQERQNRLEERGILQGLVTDFAANISQLDDMIGTHREADHRLMRLQNLPSAESTGLPSDSLFLYLRAMTISSTFDARDGTLDAVIASGNLGIIRDVRLREALIRWQARVQDLSEESQELRSSSPWKNSYPQRR